MKRQSHFKTRLHTKRAATEKKIRALEREGKAGERYTARISDVNFLIFGLLCDIGWIIHLIAGILQIILAVMTDVEGIPLLFGITAGGFMNFAFGLPIFASFKKGIYYSSESER